MNLIDHHQIAIIKERVRGYQVLGKKGVIDDDDVGDSRFGPGPFGQAIVTERTDSGTRTARGVR